MSSSLRSLFCLLHSLSFSNSSFSFPYSLLPLRLPSFAPFSSLSTLHLSLLSLFLSFTHSSLYISLPSFPFHAPSFSIFSFSSLYLLLPLRLPSFVPFSLSIFLYFLFFFPSFTPSSPSNFLRSLFFPLHSPSASNTAFFPPDFSTPSYPIHSTHAPVSLTLIILCFPHSLYLRFLSSFIHLFLLPQFLSLFVSSAIKTSVSHSYSLCNSHLSSFPLFVSFIDFFIHTFVRHSALLSHF